jgi:hypothetical protein
MSQLKAKQLKLPAAGSLLIGGTDGTGSTLPIGSSTNILKVVSGALAWAQNDNIASANSFNSVTTTNIDGVVIAVENADGSAANTLATFAAGNDSDEAFKFIADAAKLTIAAEGTATDIDIVIAPKGGGEVVIGNAGGGVIQADDGEDLSLMGGAGAGNLLINGGGTGKVFYNNDSSDPDKEIATVGDIAAAVSDATVTQTRSEFTGDATFALNANVVAASVIAHINGLVIKDDFYTLTGTTVAFSGLPYTLDSADQVVFTYEITA